MEQRSVSEIIEQYEPLLKKYEKDENLVVLEAEEEPGTKAGENYMSIVLRTKIRGRRGDGRPYRKSFMRKMLLENSQLAKVARNDALFHIEAYVYETLLPLLGPFGPDCILAQPREIIMEDLGDRNFSICERRKMLDLEHALAVTQTLASMHASSLSLKLKSPERFAELVAPLKENIFPADEEACLGSFFENATSFALMSLRSVEINQRVQRAVDFMEGYSNKVVSTIKKQLVPQKDKDDRYWVITHGDSWNNNIMFLHDSLGKVVRVKLVDFQVARHSSPALDFTYFLYSSVRSEVIERNIDEILHTYESFFAHDLRRLDVPERDLEAFARPGWFREEIKRYGLIGFFGSLMVLHAIFMDEGQAVEIEIEKTLDELNANEKTPEHLTVNPEKTERILCVVDSFIKNFTDTR